MNEFLNKPNAPLSNFFDLDPERLKPMFYGVTIDVQTRADGQGHGSLTIRNQPYIITRIVHKVIGQTADPESSGLYDDGQYSIEWQDEQRTYSQIPIAADLLAGPKGAGEYPDLQYPVYYAGTHTLNFRLTNHYARILTPVSETFRVQVVTAGLADWGKLTPPQ